MEDRKSEQLIRLVRVLQWLLPLRYGASLEQITEGVQGWSTKTIRRDLATLNEIGLIEKVCPNRWKARREPDLAQFLTRALGVVIDDELHASQSSAGDPFSSRDRLRLPEDDHQR